MRDLISLGYRWDVAFQLRFHTGIRTSHVFDWLVTPAEGLIEVLARDFDVFAPEDLELTTNVQTYPVCRRTGVRFHHQFPSVLGNTGPDFLAHHPEFAAKVAYLARRFRETVRRGPVTFVRRDIGREDACRLEETVFRAFPDADATFLYIVHGKDAFTTPVGHAVVWPQTPGDSFGSLRAWGSLLTAEGLVDAPVRSWTARALRQPDAAYRLPRPDRHAIDELEWAVSVNPLLPELWAELAVAYHGARRQADAEAALVAAEAHGLEAAAAAVIRIRLAIGAGAFDPVAVLVALRPFETPEACRLKGIAYEKLGRRREALDAFAVVLAADPFDPDAVARRSSLLVQAGEADAAIQLLAPLLRRVPDNARLGAIRSRAEAAIKLHARPA